jgi:carbon-monoxide dehydrogenase large subunit
MGEFGIGQPVPREEDPYLVRGAGRYVDDVTVPGQLRGYVLRSPHAHARIRGIDAAAAKAMPGVHLILTGRDPEIRALGTQRPQVPRKRRDGSPAAPAPQPALAGDIVHYAGDPVAFVVAETLHQAKDAAEAIEIDYEALPAVASVEDAVKTGAPTAHEAYPNNQSYLFEVGDKAAVERALAGATHVVKHRMVINRITTNAMEPRGCLAEFDQRDGRYTLRCTVQGPHVIRRALASEVLKVPETQVRIISRMSAAASA